MGGWRGRYSDGWVQWTSRLVDWEEALDLIEGLLPQLGIEPIQKMHDLPATLITQYMKVSVEDQNRAVLRPFWTELRLGEWESINGTTPFWKTALLSRTPMQVLEDPALPDSAWFYDHAAGEKQTGEVAAFFLHYGRRFYMRPALTWNNHKAEMEMSCRRPSMPHEHSHMNTAT